MLHLFVQGINLLGTLRNSLFKRTVHFLNSRNFVAQFVAKFVEGITQTSDFIVYTKFYIFFQISRPEIIYTGQKLTERIKNRIRNFQDNNRNNCDNDDGKKDLHYYSCYKNPQIRER